VNDDDLLFLPKTPIQRGNYFDRQFLTVDDFNAEQSYHRDMRRVLTGALFSPGVLIGLEVILDPSNPHNLIVKPGVAVDTNGQLLVLTQAHEETPANQSGTQYVTIFFKEDKEKTPTRSGSIAPDKENRMSEVPAVQLDPSPSPEKIIVARVELVDNQPPNLDISALTGLRKTAFLKSGGLKVSTPLYQVTTETSATNALQVIYGQPQNPFIGAALEVISQDIHVHGMYLQAQLKNGLEALRVDGNALVLGSATLSSVNAGVVTSICYDSENTNLGPGDLVMLGKGDLKPVGPIPAKASEPVLKAFPVEKASCKDEYDTRIIGFVDSKIPPTIANQTDGGFLFVVTRGLIEKAKVKNTGDKPLELGALLRGPIKDEPAGCAIGLPYGFPAKPGTVVGKVLQTLEKGLTLDNCRVYVNLM
jgi:hypothetical protein